MSAPRLSRHLHLEVCLVLGVIITAFSPARAQEYVFTKVVDSNDPIPNGEGMLFSVVDPEPTFEGGIVVFRNGPSSLAPNSIWSVTSAGTFTKLVDLNTAVPDGTGNFSALILDFSAPGPPVLSAGTVVFSGRDSASSGYTGGLYSVSATGGTITRIANRNVAIPGAATNFNGGLQFFSVDNGEIAFNGVGSNISGIYSADTKGNALTAIADSAHPAHPEFTFPIGNFAFPSISGTTVAFYGNGVFDPSTGYNALYTSPISGGFSYGEPTTSFEPLPGDSTGSFHTRFGMPRIDGSTIFFRADDANTTNPRFTGLFSVGTTGGTITNLVDINATLPGLTTISENSFTSYSASGSTLAFTAFDNADHFGLYAHTGSTITKILATGDGGPFADLHATIYSPSIGSQAADNGDIVFWTGVRFSASGIYLATPFASSADLGSALSISPPNAMVGSNATLSATVTSYGPATAQALKLVVTLPLGLDFQSAVGGVYDANTRTVTFTAASLSSGDSAMFKIVGTANATGPLTASAYANSVTPDSDRNNNHAFATTNAIFAFSSNYVIRKIVDNFTPVPDRPGQTFGIPAGLDPIPALDADRVAFIAFDPNNAPAIWSAKADGSGGLLRLVDTATDVPGGAGEKFGYLKNLRLRNGDVVFMGLGANSIHDGIYTIPVAGGTLRSVVASGSARPEGSGTFGYQDFLQNFTYGYMGDGRICFAAQNGLYAYPVAGGPASIVVYPGSNIPTAGNASVVFSIAPAISGTRVVWEATGSGDALLGSNLNDRRFFAIADIATESPSTPGNNFVFSTQFSFFGAQVEGETVVFRAFSGTGASIRGIYSITGNGPAVKLVDTNTAVPGGNGNFSAFSAAGSQDIFALSDGEVVFLGADADNRAGLYSVPAGGGSITKIIAVGDMFGGLQLLGSPSFFSQPFQPNSLGEHQVAFRGDFRNTATNTNGVGIFVAGRIQNRLANISTRLKVSTGENVLIGGLIISGTSPKSILVRGIGPSLGDLGVPDALSDPTLELHDGTGKLITSNDNWRDIQEQEIINTGIPPTNNLESAILATLEPGNYTAILRGNNDATGNSLVEVYDLEPATDLDTRLINISTRGFVQTGNDVMIGGVIIQGVTEKHLLLRAIGPSLASAGVANALTDPTLELVDAAGTTVATNDNWRDTQEQAIIDSTIPPVDDRESAIDAHLTPGYYTAIVRGKDNATGNALIEAYELP